MRCFNGGIGSGDAIAVHEAMRHRMHPLGRRGGDNLRVLEQCREEPITRPRRERAHVALVQWPHPAVAHLPIEDGVNVSVRHAQEFGRVELRREWH